VRRPRSRYDRAAALFLELLVDGDELDEHLERADVTDAELDDIIARGGVDDLGAMAQTLLATGLPNHAEPRIWMAATRVGDDATRQRLAELPHLPEPVAARLGGGTAEWVAYTIADRAANGEWGRSVIDACATNPHDRVRVQIAAGSVTPIDVLEQLADDPSDWVRELVGANPRTPEAILRRFARGTAGEREGVSCNRAAPRDLLEHLTGDTERDIARFAQETLTEQTVTAGATPAPSGR
jgi:hypothetical protein